MNSKQIHRFFTFESDKLNFLGKYRQKSLWTQLSCWKPHQFDNQSAVMAILPNSMQDLLLLRYMEFFKMWYDSTPQTDWFCCWDLAILPLFYCESTSFYADTAAGVLI